MQVVIDGGGGGYSFLKSVTQVPVPFYERFLTCGWKGKKLFKGIFCQWRKFSVLRSLAH